MPLKRCAMTRNCRRPRWEIQLLPMFIVFATHVLIPNRAAAQAETPWSLDAVVDLLAGGVPEARIKSVTSSDCVDFEMTATASGRLRAVGATTTLVNHLTMVCRRSARKSSAGGREGGAGAFGHLGASAFVLPGAQPDLPLAVELASGFGSRYLGIRGSLGAVGVLIEQPTADRARERRFRIAAAGFAAADVVILPGFGAYAFAGVGSLLPGGLHRRVGAGVALPSRTPVRAIIEMRLQDRLPQFWREVPQESLKPVLSVTVGLAERSFGRP